MGRTLANIHNRHDRTLELAAAMHHSPSDWQYQAGKGFYLDPVVFQAGPTSLAISNAAPATGIYYTSLKAASGGTIEDGRISTWRRMSNATLPGLHIVFRAVQEPYLGLPAKCYYVWIRDTAINVYRRVAGANTQIGNQASHTQDFANTWYQYRVTWYSWLNNGLNYNVRIKVERWSGAAWVVNTTVDDTNPQDISETNRYLGFGLEWHVAGWKSYIDTSVIERRTA